MQKYTLIPIQDDQIQVDFNKVKYNDHIFQIDEGLTSASLFTHDDKAHTAVVGENGSVIVYDNGSNKFYLVERHPYEGDHHNKEQETVGLTIEIVLLNVNDNQPFLAKIDTGAAESTLRVNDIHVRNNPLNGETEQVKFTIDNTTYTKDIAKYSAVQTSEGHVQQRPCITLDVKFKQSLHEDVMFNLSQQNNNEYQVLAGVNLIEVLDVHINVKESLTINDIVEALEPFRKIEEPIVSTEEPIVSTEENIETNND